MHFGVFLRKGKKRLCDIEKGKDGTAKLKSHQTEVKISRRLSPVLLLSFSCFSFPHLPFDHLILFVVLGVRIRAQRKYWPAKLFCGAIATSRGERYEGIGQWQGKNNTTMQTDRYTARSSFLVLCHGFAVREPA